MNSECLSIFIVKSPDVQVMSCKLWKRYWVNFYGKTIRHRKLCVADPMWSETSLHLLQSFLHISDDLPQMGRDCIITVFLFSQFSSQNRAISKCPLTHSAMSASRETKALMRRRPLYHPPLCFDLLQKLNYRYLLFVFSEFLVLRRCYIQWIIIPQDIH